MWNFIYFYRLLPWRSNQVSFAQYPAFNSHPLFLELAPAVHSAVDKYYKEYKDSKSPTTALILAGLDARAKEVIASSTKRSSYPLFPLRKFHRAFRIAIADAADAPTGSRPEKVKKTKNSVHFNFTPSFFSNWLPVFQVKRSRLSKETIENSDDEIVPSKSESLAPRAEDIPPLPNEALIFDNSKGIPVFLFLELLSFRLS